MIPRIIPLILASLLLAAHFLRGGDWILVLASLLAPLLLLVRKSESLTALQVLAMLRRHERPLSELADVFDPVPQVMRSVQVREKPPLDELSAVQATLERIDRDLEGRGRIHVRYSGTEPVARVMVEGEDRRRIGELAEEVCAQIRKAIGEEER